MDSNRKWAQTENTIYRFNLTDFNPLMDRKIIRSSKIGKECRKFGPVFGFRGEFGMDKNIQPIESCIRGLMLACNKTEWNVTWM